MKPSADPHLSSTNIVRCARACLPAMFAALFLVGCSILGDNKDPVTIYAPEPQVTVDPAWPKADWQLIVTSPSAARVVDSPRIAVRTSPEEVQVYKRVRWAKTPTTQLEDTVLQTLESSNKIAAVGRVESGMSADYRLVMNLRRFEADYNGQAIPAATIVVNAILLHSTDQKVVATHTFSQAVPAAGTDTDLVARAFGQALGTISSQIAGWTLVNGDTHQRDGAH